MSGYAFVGIIAKISKNKDPFAELSQLQKVNFRMFTGMAFTFIILSTLSVFRFTFTQECYLYLISIVALSSYLLFFKLKANHNLRKKINFVDNIPTILTALVILAVLILCANLISGYYGSMNDDGSYHTFKIRVILDNPVSLITHSSQPYASYTDVYPSLAHSLSASFVELFGIPIQDIVVMFSAILPAMIVFAFSASMYTIFRNKIISLIGAVLSGFFTLGYSWGPMAFNALPLLMSFFVTITGLGLIFYLFRSSEFNWISAFIISLVFIVSFQTYYISSIVIILWMAILLIIRYARQPSKLSYKFLRKFRARYYLHILGAFFIPITILIPYLIAFYNNRNPFLQNYAPDIPLQYFSSGRNAIIDLIQQRTTFNWPFDILATANFFQKFGSILTLSALAIIIIPIFFILLRNTTISSKKLILEGYALAFSLFLLLMAFLTFATNSSIGRVIVSIVDPERMWQHIFIIGVILTSITIYLGGHLLLKGLKFLWQSRNRQTGSRKTYRFVALVILSIIIFNVGLFTSSTLIPESEKQYDSMVTSLNTLHSIGPADIQMMQWIRNNISHDSIILVLVAIVGNI